MQRATVQNTSVIDEKYMRRCIQIAKCSLGKTAPNPMVGAVIVYNNTVIGEGFTSAFGGPHAEVNAIESVHNKKLLKKSTLYVTLEPCSHYGKTPPCANLIVEHKIPKVVIGLKDPHTKVAGKGIEILKNAGCEVIIGVLQEECREHHKRFLTFHEKKRPYIVLKWAETADGFIAPSKEMRSTNNPEPFWITNNISRQLVHKWRSEEQGILIGTKTALEDNPKLDVRSWSGKNPIRIVLDKNLKIPSNYHIHKNNQNTIILTSSKKEHKISQYTDYKYIDYSKNTIINICKTLHESNIQSIIVEGGSTTLQSFIDANLWDEARIFTGNSTFKNGIKAPSIKGTVLHKQQLINDQLTTLRNDQEHHI
ncbi:bifunctional diaminohydroxyphosphoribosylaminopyrimidine deaminase/5-amino-6-(5-phosphoribosylamino)uracil reductase RibD [Maribacter thermophilus]|uniref:bifunctional diaminohydroxyphosphoribosylaminopyrimidine deaminase/5-amino-6-(5-phosphoribosylamino)uracil reductase RibD n=1 Tax=Maribacter thermophilus TaxID=1197874 RepID=UPI000AE5B520|nr:bifunctional diaminohydroxyphosphoribosylaminopyrimidine deaminase/5-amino-6-(5-phosphoribosylamino)uracil reductase RibD [Maribacter thermophilus]